MRVLPCMNFCGHFNIIISFSNLVICDVACPNSKPFHYSRYMGLPQTVITAAKASTRTMNDGAINNSGNSKDDLNEDPEDIKVIHFGIV